MKTNISIIYNLLLLIFLSYNNMNSQTIIWSSKANPLNLQINSIAFRADGQKILSGTNCHPASIRIFNTETSVLEWDYSVGSDFWCIMGVTFSSNGNYISAIEEFGNVLIFDNSGDIPIILDTIKTGTSYAFSTAISPDNKKVTIGCSNGKMKIYDIQNGTLIKDINAHSNWVTSVSYSPDGNNIITGGSDDKVKIWNSEGVLQFTCNGHLGDITNVKVSPDNNFVISSSQDKRIRIWNIKNGQTIKTITGHNGEVNGIDISPDGKKIVSSSSDETCKIWDFNTGALLSTFGDFGWGSYTTVAWSPSGDKIVTGNVASDIILWDVQGLFSSIENWNLISDLHIFPNPANLYAISEVEDEMMGAELIIYDQVGKVVQVDSDISSNILKIDTKELPDGIYYVVLQKANKLISGKLLITK